MRELAGRTAVVTGAASGIGLATATRFAEAGMRVALADVEPAPLLEAEKALRASGHTVLSHATDVSKQAEVDALARRVVREFGAVHVLHNNAGVVSASPVEEHSDESWSWVLGVNLFGVIHGIRAFLPLIKQAGEGHVINTASTAGLVAPPGIVSYSVSKFGVVALSETLARELRAGANAKIGVSVLCPGAVATRIAESDRNRRDHTRTPAEQGFIDQVSPMLATQGKDPREIADLVLDAVRDQRFWIVTHDEWKPIIEERVQALVRDGSLSNRFGG